MSNKRAIGIAKESTYGTLVPLGDYIWSEATESLKSDMGYTVIDPVGKRERTKILKGNWRIRGNIGPVEIEPENIAPVLIYGALGSDSVGDLGDGAYAHTISPSNTLPTFSIRMELDDKERRVVGAIVDGFELTCRYGEAAKLTASILSGKYETVENTVNASTFSTLQPFTYADITVKLDGSTITSRLYEVTLTLSNNVIDRGSLGSRTLDTVRLGPRVISGKFSSYFENTDDWNKMKNGTEFALQIELVGETIGGDKKYSISIALPRCVVKSDAIPHVMPIREPLVLDVPFEVLYDSSNGYDIQVVVTNTRSSSY